MGFDVEKMDFQIRKLETEKDLKIRKSKIGKKFLAKRWEIEYRTIHISIENIKFCQKKKFRKNCYQ